MLVVTTALSIFASLGVSAFAKDAVLLSTDRIVNGRNASIIQFPYSASLQRHGHHICGGSILNNLWILTAAHCLEKFRPDQANSIQILMGSSNWKKGGVLKGVQEFYMHPQYDTQTMAYDIAVIKLASPVSFSAAIKPIKIATKEPKNGSPCVVSGWGFTNSRVANLEQVLKSANVIFRTKEVCSSRTYGYSSSLKETMICGEGNETDACQGDSGGPLVDENSQEQVGVVSWGYDCGLRGYPGIYSNVAELSPWVLKQLRAW